MVKNKYHSLLKKKQNVVKEDREDKLIELIIKDLEKEVEKEQEAELQKQ